MRKRIALLSVLGTLLIPNISLYAWPAVDDIAKKCGFDATSQKAYQSCSGWRPEGIANEIANNQISDVSGACKYLKSLCVEKDVPRPIHGISFIPYKDTDCLQDTQTGLVWPNKYNSGEYSWSLARKKFPKNGDGIGKIEICGQTGWRLPTVNEFYNMAEQTRFLGVEYLHKHGFTNIKETVDYWSDEPGIGIRISVGGLLDVQRISRGAILPVRSAW